MRRRDELFQTSDLLADQRERRARHRRMAVASAWFAVGMVIMSVVLLAAAVWVSGQPIHTAHVRRVSPAAVNR